MGKTNSSDYRANSDKIVIPIDRKVDITAR